MKIDMNYFNKDYEEIQNNLKKYKLKEKKLLNVKSRMFLFVFYNFSIIAKLYVKNKCKKIGEL